MKTKSHDNDDVMIIGSQESTHKFPDIPVDVEIQPEKEHTVEIPPEI